MILNVFVMISGFVVILLMICMSLWLLVWLCLNDNSMSVFEIVIMYVMMIVVIL